MLIDTACCEIRHNLPDAIIYVETGGRALGLRLSSALEIPLIPLDVRYPLSRFMTRHPVLARVVWPVKEICYRTTSPVALQKVTSVILPDHVRKVLLVDDRVSTFRTLTVALTLLANAGLSRTDITIITTRCGKKSIGRVDYVVELS